jgi:tetratricopeptide (TPR) repeat protein
MVSRRWATANTLIASLAADGDPRLATQMADEALRLADRLVRLDLKGEGRLADVSALRVRALMVGRWAQGTSEPSALELAERDGLTTRRSLENVINWCLEHDDYGEALALFDRVEASGSTLSDWAAYRSSVIAAEWAEREPEQTLTAIDRATDLIRIQPHNLTAAGRLLELISRSPPQDVAAWLKRLDLFGLYLADGQGGRGLDAIAAFCAISDRGSDATVDLSAFAAAIVGVAIDGTGTPDEWRKPGPVRVAATQLVPAVALALERYGDGSRILRAPPRLLCAILDISFDLETWARAARLTLRYRDRALADRVIGYLDAERTLVPYLATLAARLELLAGNAEAAYARLALVDSRVRRGGGDVHPAVLDLQARSAIQLGRPEDARAIYERALARQPLNSRMWFGLGQTFRESAEQPGACRAWLSALRTASIDTRGRALGLLTARAIGRISTEADSVVIDEMLAEALANSPRAAISLLAVGLRDAGRPRRAVIDAVLQMPATDRATDSRLGQLLMSSLIWETIAPETASNPHDLLLGAQRLADWGMARDVFGEIVAGARGSYASAAIERLVIPHGRAALVSLVHGGGLRIAARPAPAAFVRSIVDAERGDRDYYLKAGFAFRQLNANAKLAASLALAIIGRIGASYIEKDMPAPVGLLARHTPAITLDRLFAASGWVDEGPAALTPTAFFDRTTMLVLETIAPATHWLSSLDTFERTIADSPAVDEISVLLSRGGVNVRRDSGVVVCSVSRSATFA